MIYYRPNDGDSSGFEDHQPAPLSPQVNHNLPWYRDVKPKEVRKSTTLVSVIIPVFNEVKTISEVIANVVALPFEKEVIIVDDGSTDGTSNQLHSWQFEEHVQVVSHEKNLGKGAAIRTGIDQAKGGFTVIQDADLEYDPQELYRVLAPLVIGRADIVYGSRYTNAGAQHPHMVSRYGVQLLNKIVWWLYGIRLTDEATCYKAVRTSLLRRMSLECTGFEFCPEVTAKACRMGIDIIEVPITYNARGYEAGKKIRLHDGVTAITTLWRYRNWVEPNQDQKHALGQTLVERAAS